MIVFSLILAAYLSWRLVLPLRIPKTGKAALILLVALIAFKFHILHLIGGPMFFAPELPPAVLLVSAWAYAALFLLFFLTILLDLAFAIAPLVLLVLNKTPGALFRQPARNKANLAIAILSLVLATVGIRNGTRPPIVREATVAVKNLPCEAEGMTIAVLSDVHADKLTGARRVQEMVDVVNALKPDLIVSLGDLMDGRVEARLPDLLPLRGLSAKFGVFGVPGNHEYYSGYEEWAAVMPSLGIRMLPNEGVLLPNGVALAGVADANAARMNLDPPNVEKALQGIPEGVPIVLLSHRPDLAFEAERRGVALQLSGHTHGGMIRGVDKLVALFNGGFVSGPYRVGGLVLWVSNGTGIWNGFPIRLGVPAEAVLLRLVSADERPKA